MILIIFEAFDFTLRIFVPHTLYWRLETRREWCSSGIRLQISNKNPCYLLSESFLSVEGSFIYQLIVFAIALDSKLTAVINDNVEDAGKVSRVKRPILTSRLTSQGHVVHIIIYRSRKIFAVN